MPHAFASFREEAAIPIDLIATGRLIHWIGEVDHHLAPAFVGVNASGQKFDRTGWLEYWKSAAVTDLSLGELTVEPEGPDMVVTYELHLAGASAASASSSSVRVVSVWQQLKKGWVLIAQSLTPIK